MCLYSKYVFAVSEKNADRESQKKNIESCVRCHFPIGHSSGDANLPLDNEKTVLHYR